MKDSIVIGHSVQGREIRAYHVGDECGRQIIVTGAIHAREWITTHLIEELMKREYLGGVWFVPCCNPDGVHIAKTKNPMWKANARMVDLNVNFDADWGGGAQNVRTPGPENYIGPYPNSEPEVQSLINFTRKVNPVSTVAYHSKGEEIYYRRFPEIAKLLGKSTGYRVMETKDSTGGYSDWVSMHLGIPAFTIEVGNDALPHPIGLDQLPKIMDQNKDVIDILFATC